MDLSYKPKLIKIVGFMLIVILILITGTMILCNHGSCSIIIEILVGGDKFCPLLM
jgi:hypothetical protein